MTSSKCLANDSFGTIFSLRLSFYVFSFCSQQAENNPTIISPTSVRKYLVALMMHPLVLKQLLCLSFNAI